MSYEYEHNLDRTLKEFESALHELQPEHFEIPGEEEFFVGRSVAASSTPPTGHYRYRFTEFPPLIPDHQGTGNISYSELLAQPWTVADVSRPLGFQWKLCKMVVMCMTIDTAHAPNWYGIGFRSGIQSFNSVNIFCHPHPGNAKMFDGDYLSRGGNWPRLFRYVQNLSCQLDAGACDQILVIPFFNNATYGTGGIFAPNWKEIVSVIVNGVKAALPLDPRARPYVDLRAFDNTLPVRVENVVLSCFSFGRCLMGTLRQNMPGLGGFLREVWDFDGNGCPRPTSSSKVKAILYDQEVTNSPSAFHVPKQRWSAFPGFPKTDAHGGIPNRLMWHTTTVSAVGK